jgi:phage terminase large subunit-like protein
MFIAWALAKNPKAQFIHLSYSDELALDNSARVKELIALDEYQALWNITLNPDRKAKGLWRTCQGGGLKAGAAGGSVTGFGAGVDDTEFGGAIIVDDPLKPDDEEYETIRRKTNRRLNATIKSRLNSKVTPIIMIMQRLHDNDPSGFVLNGGTGEKWEHLKIPVLRPDGSPLWEFRHGVEELAAIRAADKYVWNGQYKQEPIDDSGDYFHADQARWYDELPKHLNFYGASDFAVSEGKGDYTEHGLFGVCPDGNVYVVDWWSGQTKADIWFESMLDFVAVYRPLKWGGESGPIKASVEPFLMKRMRERRTYVAMYWVNHSTAQYKTAGARGFQALWEAGRVYLPKNQLWADDLLLQLTRFPLGILDDKVDTCSIFTKMINKIWEQVPKEEKVVTMVADDAPIVLEHFAPKTNQSTW